MSLPATEPLQEPENILPSNEEARELTLRTLDQVLRLRPGESKSATFTEAVALQRARLAQTVRSACAQAQFGCEIQSLVDARHDAHKVFETLKNLIPPEWTVEPAPDCFARQDGGSMLHYQVGWFKEPEVRALLALRLRDQAAADAKEAEAAAEAAAAAEPAPAE